MADEQLNYEAMLSALQGLLGQEVFVIVDLRYAGDLRPVAALRGILRAGLEADLSLAELGYPLEGESILFFVGGDGAFLVLRRDDFKLGRREDGLLIFGTGRAEISIALVSSRRSA